MFNRIRLSFQGFTQGQRFLWLILKARIERRAILARLRAEK